MLETARIVARKEDRVSPWVRVVSKEVEFSRDRETEVYHCLGQSDYIAILAKTRSGLIPIVRQYRPAVEAYTWELPAGLLEKGEDLEVACRRELKEETGLDATAINYLGSYYVDTGRLENRLHAFYVRTSDPDPAFVPEPGMSVHYVSAETLREHVVTGEFIHQVHLGVIAAAFILGVYPGANHAG